MNFQLVEFFFCWSIRIFINNGLIQWPNKWTTEPTLNHHSHIFNFLNMSCKALIKAPQWLLAIVGIFCWQNLSERSYYPLNLSLHCIRLHFRWKSVISHLTSRWGHNPDSDNFCHEYLTVALSTIRIWNQKTRLIWI